ncbi:MAG TPA: AI-2E family transporter [Micromonosporaceae bacterium]
MDRRRSKPHAQAADPTGTPGRGVDEPASDAAPPRLVGEPPPSGAHEPRGGGARPDEARPGEVPSDDARDGGGSAEPVSLRTVYRYGVAAGLGLLTVWLGYLSVRLVANVLVQIAIAVFIAVSLDPAVRWMIGRGVKRSQAVAIIFIVAFAVVAGFLALIIPPMVKQGTSLASDFPGYLEHLRQRSPSLAALEDRFNLQSRIDRFARTAPTQLSKEALGFSQRFFGALVSFLLVIVLTVYVMADLPRLRRGLVRLFPKRNRPRVGEAVNVVIDKVGAYMIGNIIISVIAGTAAFIAMIALRIPFAGPLAFLVAITDLIPMIGATLGAVTCVIVAFATTDLIPTLILAAFFIGYQQAENYVIAPRVLRGTVDMPALAVLLAALLGGSVLGLVGALMAIPFAAAVKVLATGRLRERDEHDGDDPAADRAIADQGS